MKTHTTIFFSSRRRHTRFKCDWSSDVCSSDLGGAETHAGGDRHVAGEQRERLVHRIVEGDVVARPHAVEAERLDATDEVELLGRWLERELDAEAQALGTHRGKASLTPPSTVSVQPVVLDARSEARNSTASATSSGRMRAPSRLRLR